MDVDLSRWGSIELIERIAEGNRNEVWRGSLESSAVSVRRSRRRGPSLEWELDLIAFLDDAELRVASVIETTDGARHVDGVVVQRWLEGRAPVSGRDWVRVGETLQRLHRLTAGYPQRPGCCVVTDLGRTGVSLDADLAAMPADIVTDLVTVFGSVGDAPVAVVHGDPSPSNIRIDGDDVVGLLDFDESRVDVCWHDLSNLGVVVLDEQAHRQAELLSDAWEAAAAWTLEPDYARHRLRALRQALRG